jgi:hypothetical protein
MQTFCWSHIDEYYWFNVYFQKLVVYHLDCHLLSILEILVAFYKLIFHIVISAILVPAVESHHHEDINKLNV